MLKARFKNFYKFTDFVCEFGDRVTHLVGINGSGKSTVAYKGLLACLNGISENRGGLLGKRFLFIGAAGKSADVEYTFRDEENGGEFTVKRHITSSGQELKFQSKSDAPIDDAWLRTFLKVSLMSAKNFCALSGREQAAALGIDTTVFKEQLTKLKADFTLLNRDLKNMGEIAPVEPAEMLNVQEILSRKENLRSELNAKYLANKKHNDALRVKYEADKEAREKRETEHSDENARRSENIKDANDAAETLERVGYDCAGLVKWIATMPALTTFAEPEIPAPKLIEEMPDDSELQLIDSELLRASETNAKAGAYIEYKKKVKTKEAKKAELAANKKKQDEVEAETVAYIKQFKFPFAGLGIDDEGGLTLEGRPLTESYFSRGELELIVAQLHASLNPAFKTRFIDDFDLIDDANQEKILAALDEKGFQVITAEVRKTKDRENTLILRECAIATDEEESPRLI